MRVVAADDSLVVREGVRALLGASPDVELVALAEDLDGLLAAVQEHRPDAVLADLRMPPTGTDEGVRAAGLLRRTHPGTGVVVLSQHLEVAHAVELVREGSAGRGYLLKDRLAEPAVLVAALRDVAAGRSCVDPLVVDALLRHGTAAAGGAVPRGLDALTAREREVLAEVATGASNQVIAQRLVISKGAVEKHINAVFAKLGLTDEEGASRRVAAVLVHLAETDQTGRVSAGPAASR